MARKMCGVKRAEVGDFERYVVEVEMHGLIDLVAFAQGDCVRA